MGRVDLDLPNTSRVVLEAILRRLAWQAAHGYGGEFDAAMVRAELASRTWQNVNPYAPGLGV